MLPDQGSAPSLAVRPQEQRDLPPKATKRALLLLFSLLSKHRKAVLEAILSLDLAALENEQQATPWVAVLAACGRQALLGGALRDRHQALAQETLVRGPALQHRCTCSSPCCGHAQQTLLSHC